ncbi:MAG: hypothetical protein AAGA99_14650 [Actinomycetota bacterium]
MGIGEVLPDGAARATLDDAHGAAWEVVDAGLLSLARDRMAMLLGHRPTVDALTEERRASLADPGRLPEVDQAVLALVEHYLIDVASVPDELVEPVREHLGDQGLVDLVNAVLVVEQRMRLELIWESVL